MAFLSLRGVTRATGARRVVLNHGASAPSTVTSSTAASQTNLSCARALTVTWDHVLKGIHGYEKRERVFCDGRNERQRERLTVTQSQANFSAIFSVTGNRLF